MPEAFDNCVKQGGKVRTIKPNAGTYQHVCILNGKTYAGEVKHKQSNSHSGVGRKRKKGTSY